MGGEEVQACLSHSLSLFPGSLHPAFHKLCTPIYTRLHFNDFNAMCLSSIEKKGRESSSLRAFVEVYFHFHAMLQGIDS